MWMYHRTWEWDGYDHFAVLEIRFLSPRRVKAPLRLQLPYANTLNNSRQEPLYDRLYPLLKEPDTPELQSSTPITHHSSRYIFGPPLLSSWAHYGHTNILILNGYHFHSTRTALPPNYDRNGSPEGSFR